MVRFSASAWFIVLLSGLGASADSPLPAPTETQFRSPNGRFLAVSDPKKYATTVYELGPRAGARKASWSMPGWFRQAELADDGMHLLIVTGDLLTLDFDWTNPVLQLVRKGELVKTVTVMDVARKESNLQRTVSHYSLEDFLGIDQAGRYRIRAHDGQIFLAQDGFRGGGLNDPIRRPDLGATGCTQPVSRRAFVEHGLSTTRGTQAAIFGHHPGIHHEPSSL